MPRYFAFLRAINVGGHMVRMEALRGHFTDLGFLRVETFINSGNVIFECRSGKTETLETRIAGHLQSQLGFPVATFLRSDAELAAVRAYSPFAAEDMAGAGACCVGFLARPLEPAQRDLLLGLATDVDNFHTEGRELYWLCRKKQSESRISNGLLERKLKTSLTFRNRTSVTKLAAKYL